MACTFTGRRPGEKPVKKKTVYAGTISGIEWGSETKDKKILITTDAALQHIGTLVEIRATWPLLRDGNKPLTFVACGKVNGGTDNDFVVQVVRHDLKTFKGRKRAA